MSFRLITAYLLRARELSQKTNKQTKTKITSTHTHPPHTKQTKKKEKNIPLSSG